MTGGGVRRLPGGNAEEYAGELAAAGMTEEAAAQQSREQMAQLIPDGLASPGMHFFTAWVGDAPVGSLWLCTPTRWRSSTTSRSTRASAARATARRS